MWYRKNWNEVYKHEQLKEDITHLQDRTRKLEQKVVMLEQFLKIEVVEPPKRYVYTGGR